VGTENQALAWLLQVARMKLVLLIVGGALGTCLRYYLSRWLNELSWTRGFPLGTFVINVSGSFILGFAAALIHERLPPEQEYLYVFIGTGFCGGYTTFSTFELETVQLVSDGSWLMAMLNVVGSVVLGFIGVLAGRILVRLLFPQS
jgi:fluoride exporter